MYYEHLMQQVPNFDKAPREIKDESCLVCEGYGSPARESNLGRPTADIDYFCKSVLSWPAWQHRAWNADRVKTNSEANRGCVYKTDICKSF